MGLDMYLMKKTYVKNWSFMEPNERNEVSITVDGKPHPDIRPERIFEIVEEVAYWRKANQIHGWFVKNVQDGNDNCAEYHVSREVLQELIDECKSVLEKKANPKSALPTTKGLFFGNDEYNESYYDDLRDTVSMIEPLLKENGGTFYYTSSW